MAAKNIRSIEQLKNIRKKEAGAIIGFKRIGSVSSTWCLFYQSSRRSAQIEFCKRLSQLGAKTPGKKDMVIQVAQY